MHISRNVRAGTAGLSGGTRAAARTLGSLLAAACLATSVLGPAAVPVASGATGVSAEVTATESAALLTSSPFVSNRASGTWYRIPSIIKTPEGALLVFAERRNNSDGSDNGDFEVVMRKSTDGGRTWGAIKTIADDGRSKVSSPVTVLDPLTGDALLVTMVRKTDGTYAGSFLQRSADSGGSFTSLFANRLTPNRAWTGRPGPGHSIVLTKGPHAGRIVIPLSGGHGVYSDDGGNTWRSGYHQSESGNTECVEGTIAELPSGALFIVYRDANATTPGLTKRYGYSLDGGATLSAPLAPLSGVKVPSVEGSALNPTGSHAGELYLSAPSYNKAGDPAKRRDMSIFVSKDGGATWGTPYPIDLESKAGSYSDLVQMDDGTVGILYETGRISWLERIVFKTVRMDQLTNPTKVASSLSAHLSDSTITTAQHAKSNTAVVVKGILRPLGKVVVRYTNTSTAASGTVGVSMVYTNLGKRCITLPKLKKGTYAISVTYQGAFRISGRTVSGGTLHVR